MITLAEAALAVLVLVVFELAVLRDGVCEDSANRAGHSQVWVQSS